MTEQTLSTPARALPEERSLAAQAIPVLGAALLGVVILAAVGFAPGLAHNAAHDTRHVMVFPCH